jgi:cold shock protein
MAELQRGVVKWFNDAKGFGFIEHTSGRDVFVHYSVIEWDGFKTLKDGEEVDYELCEGDKGLHASKVVRTAAARKKREAELAAKLAKEPMIAPNLESGSINTAVRTAASMIEVELDDQAREASSESLLIEQDLDADGSTPAEQ